MTKINLILTFFLFSKCVDSFSQISHPRGFVESLHKQVENFVNIPKEELYTASEIVKLVQNFFIENIDEVVNYAVSSGDWGQCLKDLEIVVTANGTQNFKFWDSFAVPYTGYAMLRRIFPGNLFLHL